MYKSRLATCYGDYPTFHEVQELKGNIRVFCRVRPLSQHLPVVEAGENGQPLIQFATTGDTKLF